MSAHVVQKGAAFVAPVDEDEKTTLETGWQDDQSTTTDKGDVMAQVRSELTATRRAGTHETMVEEPTVDDQHAHAAYSLTLAPSPARLLVTQGSDVGREFEIRPADGKTYTVGRAIENDIVLTDIAVSRRHFDLAYEGGRWMMSDRGSGNGTLVNGQVEDQPVALSTGDTIELGTTIFRFESRSGNEQTNDAIPMGWGRQHDQDEPSTIAGRPGRSESPARATPRPAARAADPVEPRLDPYETRPEPRLDPYETRPEPRLELREPPPTRRPEPPRGDRPMPSQRTPTSAERGAAAAARARPRTQPPPPPPRSLRPPTQPPLPLTYPPAPAGYAPAAAQALPQATPPPSQAALMLARAQTHVPAALRPAEPAGRPGSLAALLGPAPAPVAGPPPPYPGHALDPPLAAQSSGALLVGPGGPAQAYPGGPAQAYPGGPFDGMGAPGQPVPFGTNAYPPMAYAPRALSRRAKLNFAMAGGLAVVIVAIVAVVVGGRRGVASAGARAPVADKAPAAGQTATVEPIAAPRAEPKVVPPPAGDAAGSAAADGPRREPTTARSTEPPAPAPAKLATVPTRVEPAPAPPKVVPPPAPPKVAPTPAPARPAPRPDPTPRPDPARTERTTAKATAPERRPEPRRAPVDTSAAESKATEQYAAKNFAGAAATLRAAARGVDEDAARDLKAKASEYELLGRAIAAGTTPGTKPVDAYGQLRKAEAYDRELGGALAGELREKLAAVAPRAATAFMAQKNYEEAYQVLRAAEGYGAGKTDTLVSVRRTLELRAAELYNTAMNERDSNPEDARAQLKRILKFVDAKSQWYQKASKSLASK